MQLNKDFLVIFFGKIIQVFIMIATLKISTMLLSPEQMGIMYIFLSIQTFFIFTFISPVGQYINRKTHSWNKHNSIWNNLFLFNIYIVIIALLAVLVSFILHEYFTIINQVPLDNLLYLMFGFIVFITLNQTIIPLLNMLHYRISFTVLTILTSLGILVFGYIFISVFNNGIISWLSGLLLSNITILIIGYIILNKKINSNFVGIIESLKLLTKDKIKSILKIVLPISLATLLMWIQGNGYKFIVEQNLGLEFLGFLGVGLAIASQIASIVESIITQYLSPIYYQKISNANLEDRIKTFNWLLNIKIPIYLLLALYVTFLAPYIVNILVDEQYASVYFFTIFGIWIEFFRMVTNVLYTVSLSELKTKKVIIPYLIGAIVSIGLIYLSSLQSDYKLYIPLSLILGGIITAVIMYINMKKLLCFSIDYRILQKVIMLSIPYILILNFTNKNIITSLVIVAISGMYFLGTVYFVYLKKGELK
jgi:O-antigen/teichoic acid export membrane protein